MWRNRKKNYQYSLAEKKNKQKNTVSGAIYCYTRCTIVVGYYGFTLVIRVSVRPFVIRPSVFSFQDDNLSKYQWIFTKLGMCIDILEIGFVSAN